MSEHTPGPWEIAPRSDSDELWEIVTEYQERDGKKIANWIAEIDAQVDPMEMSEREQEEAMEQAGANARLIAAAPELLEACKLALDEFVGAVVRTTQVDAAFRSIEAAIAKAEGRS